VVEELVSGVVQRSYTYGHALISQTQVSGSLTTSFYGDDGLGSMRRILADTDIRGIVDKIGQVAKLGAPLSPHICITPSRPRCSTRRRMVCHGRCCR